MLNYLWPIFLIVSFIYAIFVGNIDEVNKSIFDSVASAVNLSITFLGTICLWNGIMKIIQSTSLIEKLTKMLNPIIKFTTLFGLLALELALVIPSSISIVCAAIFFIISIIFVVRSFTGMLIK